MKATTNTLGLFLCVYLTGCGGGGGSTSDSPTLPPTGTNPTQPVPTPTPTTVTNPLTGTAAPGSPTKVIRGIAAVGATVTAYSVQANGSSGPALGAAVTADKDGYFTVNTTEAPMGMIRLVATGGTSVRALDNTTQPAGTQQLVAPFVTTSYNNFKISPLTDIAANAMASRASKGESLANAFSAGARNVLELDSANSLMQQDTSVYLNLLKGSVKSDARYYDAQSLEARELLMGLEALGVILDLPSKDVARVVGASAQSDYAATGVDGSGAAIVTGAWANGTFDPAAPTTLKALMDAKVPEAQKVADSTGAKVAPRLNEYFRKYMVMDFVMDAACVSGSSTFFTSRYPFYQVDSQGRMQAADCAGAAQRVAELRARISTNNSSRMK
ncbi:hypothetical protein [Massilia timonae]|uniref:Uncharacterized protein n=1 Tax=Massilia timonae TaxID=47229 RepID=A0A1S2N3J7_9BURK|nr:hypothetical protein [Massilia timonae]OIJ39649.1 hypothetical protein LO55_1264 [Massilia timonae]